MSHSDPNKSVNLTIDGIPVTVPEGTTILEAARKVNVTIPTLCDYPGLGKRAVCRLCVVECDGRGKLVPACTNEVWEGVKVVTNNVRILNIRKTIIELLLANHPQECLTCIRNGKCELQTMAATLGVRTHLQHEAPDRRQKKIESETLVRETRKCIKCGRCIEVCQEVQTIRAINTSHRSNRYQVCTPYRQALIDGPCIFCGQCAAVCPVGAIYEHDETAQVWAAINNSEQRTAVQIVPLAAKAVDIEFGLAPGTVTNGKMVTALKRLGFDKVFDAGFFADLTVKKESNELLDRVKNGGKITKPSLPMIVSCSPGWINFIKKIYPGLVDHLPVSKSPEQLFRTLIKSQYPELDPSQVVSVSVVPCVSKKFEVHAEENNSVSSAKPQMSSPDIALTIRELVRMIKLAGIEFNTLPESPFDSLENISGHGEFSNTETNSGLSDLEAVLREIYGAYKTETRNAETRKVTPVEFKELQAGIKEAQLEVQNAAIKILTVDGLANARIVMDSILKAECNAALVQIMNCPMNSCGSN